MTRGSALALVGAQWGSEGKGVIAHRMAGSFAAAVRVGGPNAGHSFYEAGTLYVARSVPCIWTNPKADLFIGAGAVVNLQVLHDELAALPSWVRVTIDPTAVMITPQMEERELETIRATIGSTAEGVGEARIARLRRDGHAVLARDIPWGDGPVQLGDVAGELCDVLDRGGQVMLEGTQGSGLSLYHGSQYPYATSNDTNAAALASEAGIAPSDVGHVHLVARTFPIRVAGTSGPMGEELEWSWFVERGLVEVPEKTTVTKKTRRISRWHWPVVDRAVMLNRPCGIWLTFGDYLDVRVRGGDEVYWSTAVTNLTDEIEERYGVPVLGVGTGPRQEDGRTVDFAVAPYTPRCNHGVSW